LSGTLQLQGVQVGGSIELAGATLTHPSVQESRSYSVGLRAATVGRDLVMAPHMDEPLRAEGGVNLDGVQVARRLTLHGALLGSLRTRVALDAGDAVADEFLLTPGGPPQGRAILRRAHCVRLADNRALWQATGRLEVEDFRYDTLYRPIALDDDEQVDDRVALLRAAMNGYRPGPYDQLATMLRASGNEEHAATVLMRKQQYRYDALARGSNPVVGAGVRLWSRLQRAVVGYGYRPTRALLCLGVLLVLGSLWFGLVPDTCVDDPRYVANGPRCLINADDTGLEWNPVLHTADLLVPIVDLGNKGRWHMGGADKWVATAFIASGWILVTTVAAGVARMLRRN
ncbi:MAG: oxidoreductase, partial [Thermocrispum sp.]